MLADIKRLHGTDMERQPVFRRYLNISERMVGNYETAPKGQRRGAQAAVNNLRVRASMIDDLPMAL